MDLVCRYNISNALEIYVNGSWRKNGVVQFSWFNQTCGNATWCYAPINITSNLTAVRDIWSCNLTTWDELNNAITASDSETVVRHWPVTRNQAAALLSGLVTAVVLWFFRRERR